jgi:hypothetical protein
METSGLLQASKDLVEEFSIQLQVWKDHLPTSLWWDDDLSLSRALVESGSRPFILDIHDKHCDIVDPALIMIALLQTRHKFASFLIYRPYIYKALHDPEFITEDDLNGCIKALKVSFMPHSVQKNSNQPRHAHCGPYFCLCFIQRKLFFPTFASTATSISPVISRLMLCN